MSPWNPDPNDEIPPGPGGTFELLPAGRYRFEVVESTPKTWPSGDQYWNLRLAPLEPAGYEHLCAWYKLSFPAPVNPNSTPDQQKKQRQYIGRAKHNIIALGLLPTTIEPNEPESAVGKTCIADVEHDEYMKNGQKRLTTRIWDLEKDKGLGSVGGSAPPSGPVSDEQAESEIPF